MTRNITCLMDQKSELDEEKISSNGSNDEEVEVKSNENADTEQPNPVQVEDDTYGNHSDTPSTKDHLGEEIRNESSCSESSKGEQSASVKEAVPTPCNGNQDSDPSRNQGEENLSQEKTEHDHDDNGGLVPFLIGGGLALLGAVAGIAVHASNNSNDEDKRKKCSSKESP
mmetsp:Transcript_29673/g.62943  ORF Transcript_29673/g.62943 Transcript_29673/m.62943 type:complete len:170 (-) Transcript_29673:175-684(-)